MIPLRRSLPCSFLSSLFRRCSRPYWATRAFLMPQRLMGIFFSVFARVHPRYKFPHISLLAVGGVGFIFSLLFKLGDVITAILAMRILVQFVSQAIGLLYWHYKKPDDERPYKMPLFPLPAILSIIIWLFIYSTIKIEFILSSLGIIAAGVLAYFIFMRKRNVL